MVRYHLKWSGEHQYLSIVVTILQTPPKLPRGQGTKGEDGARRAMRERGLQPRSSNYTGERVTRDESLKREVVRRQFHFHFPFCVVPCASSSFFFLECSQVHVSNAKTDTFRHMLMWTHLMRSISVATRETYNFPHWSVLHHRRREASSRD